MKHWHVEEANYSKFKMKIDDIKLLAHELTQWLFHNPESEHERFLYWDREQWQAEIVDKGIKSALKRRFEQSTDVRKETILTDDSFRSEGLDYQPFFEDSPVITKDEKLYFFCHNVGMLRRRVWQTIDADGKIHWHNYKPVCDDEGVWRYKYTAKDRGNSKDKRIHVKTLEDMSFDPAATIKEITLTGV